MTAEHTPGPWEIHEHHHIAGEFWCSIGATGRGPITDIVGEEGNKSKYYMPVAGMIHLVTPVEVQKANAFLIAAAPTLLTACEKLDAYFREFISGPNSVILADETKEVWRQVCDAITLARGGTPPALRSTLRAAASAKMVGNDGNEP